MMIISLVFRGDYWMAIRYWFVNSNIPEGLCIMHIMLTYVK